jgi:hypothetical protein
MADFVCIRNCDNKAINVYQSDKCYSYTEGKVYQYYMISAYQRNTIYTSGLYCGWVNNDFVKENFIPKEEYDKMLQEVDTLFWDSII